MFGFRNNIRVKGWEKDILAKLLFVAEKMTKKNSKTLIITGDLLDKSSSKDWSFNLYLRQMKILKEIFIDKDIEIYSIQGNHDMFNGHETTEDTVFGKLIEDGIINHLKKLELENLILYGIDYSSDEERIISKIAKISELELDRSKKVGIVLHSNVTPVKERFTDFTYDKLSQYNIDLFICGHYHIGFEDKVINNTLFINPWNMTRVVRDYSVKLDEHTPEMVILNTETLETEHIELPFKKFTEAFIPEAVNLLETKNFNFFDKIDFEKLKRLSNSETDEDILKKISEELDNLTPEEKERVLKIALSYI